MKPIDPDLSVSKRPKSIFIVSLSNLEWSPFIKACCSSRGEIWPEASTSTVWNHFQCDSDTPAGQGGMTLLTVLG